MTRLLAKIETGHGETRIVQDDKKEKQFGVFNKTYDPMTGWKQQQVGRFYWYTQALDHAVERTKWALKEVNKK